MSTPGPTGPRRFEEMEKEKSPRRHIRVACALIEERGRVLAAQRAPSMSLPLKWEFPGGKIDEGESPGECLHRELREELGITVRILESLPPATHRYEDFTVTLHPMRCAVTGGEITLHEHAAVAWLTPGEMLSLDWAEADVPVIRDYIAARRR